ncbi:MAG: hypothetical protein ACREKE_05040 [bacterium]
MAGWLLLGGPHSNGELGGGELAQAQGAPALEAKARAAVGQADLAELRSSIASFQAAKGRLPQDLNELQSAGFIQTVPVGVGYDSSTGDVHPR